MTIAVIPFERVSAIATPELVFTAVRDALIAHANGSTAVPPPPHLSFPATDGDCRVKAGHIEGSTDFTVKIATGFYRNQDKGLPSNHGLLVVLSAATGEPLAVLEPRLANTIWWSPARADST